MSDSATSRTWVQSRPAIFEVLLILHARICGRTWTRVWLGVIHKRAAVAPAAHRMPAMLFVTVAQAQSYCRLLPRAERSGAEVVDRALWSACASSRTRSWPTG